MLVVDASALVRAIAEQEAADELRARLDHDGELAAPHLIDLEVLQTLRRFVRHGEMTVDRAHIAFEDFTALDLTRCPHQVLIDRVWALRDRLSAYDAAYVALAESIGIPLVTSDSKLAAGADGLVAIELHPPLQ